MGRQIQHFFKCYFVYFPSLLTCLGSDRIIQTQAVKRVFSVKGLGYVGAINVNKRITWIAFLHYIETCHNIRDSVENTAVSRLVVSTERAFVYGFSVQWKKQYLA